jgi:hypothetical protein
MVRLTAQMPRREHPAGQLTLPAPWRHQEHQAGRQALLDVLAELLQAPADVFMDPSGQVVRVQALHERQKPALGQHPLGHFRQGLGVCGWG